MAETLLVISALKSLGIDVGRIIESMFILFVVFSLILFLCWKYVWPKVQIIVANFQAVSAAATKASLEIEEMKEFAEKVKDSIDNLNNTLQEHIVQTSLSFDSGAEEFKDIKERLSKLEAVQQQGGRNV
ncbi:hypothetical protein phi1422_0069 [Bdellovibrio phage phi1422]|uniref:hypothetical protein n=1 Tax=Bdellovibrio phage phi1422 TaxID=1127515 RepID=UPI0002536D79|nr:hypothetical protein F395_gp69 [Bdellovibrio phage phi1422]AFC22589.1 hypothetical protein phi1422_0069 [Bdellovibrio phage phi1422]